MPPPSADIVFALFFHFFFELEALLEDVVNLSATSGVGGMFIMMHHFCDLCSKFAQLLDDHDLDNGELAGFELTVF